MTGADRFEAARRAANVPPVTVGVRSVAERLDRHITVLVAEPGEPDPARLAAAQAGAQLLRDISPGRPSATASKRRVSLFAPLRSFKRWFGL